MKLKDIKMVILQLLLTIKIKYYIHYYNLGTMIGQFVKIPTIKQTAKKNI